MTAAAIPPSARFRRAEGLQCEVSLCRPDDPVTILCRRQGGDRTQVVPPPIAGLVGQLSRWSTVEEAGAPLALLSSLVEADLLFWSRETPDRDLVNMPLTDLTGRVGMARNVAVLPLLGLPDGQISPFPFMARRGMLDQAVLLGAVFNVLEMDQTVFSLRICCCPQHGALLRNLVPQLDGRADGRSICRTDEEQLALRMLNAFGMLDDAAPAEITDGQVTWLGHAGVLYAAGGARLLIDPLFQPTSRPSRRLDRPVHFRDVTGISAVLITHGDNDHLNPQTLFALPRSVPVILPRPDRAEPYQTDMHRIVSLLGFTDIREVGEWERLRFGGVTVVAAPFRGEDWGLRLAARTYLLASDEAVIFANADSTSAPEVHERLAAEFEIDLAFLGVSGASETYCMPPGFGYGEFYAPWIPAERRNEWVQLCNGPAQAAEAAVQLVARHAFGYAAGGASYFELGYVDRGTHEELAEHLAARNEGPRPLKLAIGEPLAVRELRAT